MLPKKYIFLLSTILMLLFTSEKCGNEHVQNINIVGDWVVDSIQMIPGEPNSTFSSDTNSKGAIYHFNGDSTFSMSNDSSGRGNYSMVTENDKNFLIFINPYMGIKTKFEILTKTSDKLKIEMDNQSYSIFIYFTKME
ncbi:MAG: hypothetical protein ACHQFW_04780 [Chitinophagales bacterium]